MILTEEAAKEKQCRALHAAMIPAQAARIAGSPMQMNYGYGNCYASKCMAWRWLDPENGNEPGPNREGYCGLAGVPFSLEVKRVTGPTPLKLAS